ncbi:MAG: SRPBCC family protein [Bdellovibrionota bacterium]
MVKKILISLALVIGGFLVYVGFQPADYKISRELAIKATPEVLFPYINNSKKANEWMPWKDSDPGIKMEFSGPDEGVGSISSWNSDGQMGVGTATVVESTLHQSVKTKLVTEKPMAMEQLADISLTPAGDSTVVNWTVTGKNNFIARIFCVFMDMDKMVGPEFEKGLNTLKATVEAAP